MPAAIGADFSRAFYPRRNENAFVFEDGFRVGGRRPGRAVRVGAGLKGGPIASIHEGGGDPRIREPFPDAFRPVWKSRSGWLPNVRRGCALCGEVRLHWRDLAAHRRHLYLPGYAPARALESSGRRSYVRGRNFEGARVDRAACVEMQNPGGDGFDPSPPAGGNTGDGAEKYYLEPGKIVSRPIIIETGGVIAGGPRTPDCESLGDRAETPAWSPPRRLRNACRCPPQFVPGDLGGGRLCVLRRRGVFKSLLSCGYGRKTGGWPYSGRDNLRKPQARTDEIKTRCAPKLPGFFPALSWGRLSEAPVSSGCGGENGQRAEPVLRAFPDFFPAGRCAPLTGIFRGLRFRIFRRIPADPPAAERAASARGRRPRSPPRPRAAPAALSAELPPFRA